MKENAMSGGRAHHPTEFYRSGATPIVASRRDQRFSYCLYVPFSTLQNGPHPLVVIVHGTGRTGPAYRDAMAEFCEQRRCIILAPIFPAGIDDPNDLHNFKFIEYRGIRYDELLLSMVDEVAEKYPIDTSRFLLQGFSGGGQFVHRFLYLWPHRLRALSIGAPGRVTLIDDNEPWWLGTGGMAELFGRSIDLEAMRRVQIQLVVGDRDVETWEINNRGDSNWMDGAERTGCTRIERLVTLRDNFAANGIEARLDVVPGVGHEGMRMLDTIGGFFGDVLDGVGTAG